MFDDVLAESTERIIQSTLLLNQIRILDEALDMSSTELIKIQKGLLFVSLYASIEYTVTSCCSNLLAILQGKDFIPINYKNNLLCLLLDSKFKAIRDSGNKTRWQKKEALIASIFSMEKPTIDNTVFPTEGTNIGLSQLQDVWKFLHLPDPIVPDGENQWYLNDIKDHRNAIAHGRMKAAEVGQRYTIAELEKRHNFVSMLCGHIIATFTSQVMNEGFLREIA